MNKPRSLNELTATVRGLLNSNFNQSGEEEPKPVFYTIHQDYKKTINSSSPLVARNMGGLEMEEAVEALEHDITGAAKMGHKYLLIRVSNNDRHRQCFDWIFQNPIYNTGEAVGAINGPSSMGVGPSSMGGVDMPFIMGMWQQFQNQLSAQKEETARIQMELMNERHRNEMEQMKSELIGALSTKPTFLERIAENVDFLDIMDRIFPTNSSSKKMATPQQVGPMKTPEGQQENHQTDGAQNNEAREKMTNALKTMQNTISDLPDFLDDLAKFVATATPENLEFYRKMMVKQANKNH